MPSVLVCSSLISSTVLNSIDDDFKAELAQRFKSDGMLAYVETVQRKEKEIGCDVLTHQKWYASIFF
jgi:isocitrate lyase